MSRRRDDRTADLLSWSPPAATRAFDRDDVQAAGLQMQVCKALKVALAASGKDRDTIAREMGEFLGERVSRHMLDAWCSPARTEHVIGLTRFIALVHVTRDQRLLQLLAEPFGWAVVDARHLTAIEVAQLGEKKEQIERQLELKKRLMRGGAA